MTTSSTRGTVDESESETIIYTIIETLVLTLKTDVAFGNDTYE